MTEEETDEKFRLRARTRWKSPAKHKQNMLEARSQSKHKSLEDMKFISCHSNDRPRSPRETRSLAKKFLMKRRIFSIDSSEILLLDRPIAIRLLISLLLVVSFIEQHSYASLIIGDSAIEIQEVDGNGRVERPTKLDGPSELSSIVLGKTEGDAAPQSNNILSQADSILASDDRPSQRSRQVSPNRQMPSPLPPLGSSTDKADDSLQEVISAPVDAQDERAITGRVVDFELTPAGGHNKAKVKKKKKKKKEEKHFKQWDKKKKSEKKMEEKKHKEGMKKKKEEGKVL